MSPVLRLDEQRRGRNLSPCFRPEPGAHLIWKSLLKLTIFSPVYKISSLCIFSAFGWLQLLIDYSQISLSVLDLSPEIQVVISVCLAFPL